MNIKQKKYCNITQFCSLLNKQKNSINLITHISDYDSTQSNLLQTFCTKRKIQHMYIKLNLLKKLTRNSLFLNLYAGPTRMFFFEDLTSFTVFLKERPLAEKIIPLAVFYNNQLFSYFSFLKTIESYSKFPSLNKQELRLSLIKNLMGKPTHFITNLSYNFKTFMQFLTHIKINKNN